MRPHLWTGLALAALCYQSPAHAGGLRTLWEVDLGKVISAGSGLRRSPFSPLVFPQTGADWRWSPTFTAHARTKAVS